MDRLRWALARLLAPERIIRDPFPDEEGVFVYYQSDPAKPYRLQWVVKAERFDYGPDDFGSFEPPRTFTRFVGTVGQP